jgi:hypothetical protein
MYVDVREKGEYGGHTNRMGWYIILDHRNYPGT